MRVIDPINNSSAERIFNSRQLTEDSVTRRKNAENRSVSFNNSASFSRDRVTVSNNLRIEFEQLRQTSKSLYDQVRQQLNEYFGIELQPRGDEADSATPPEDATAQELLEYFSPANTASRIAEFSLGFFDAFKGNNPNLSEEEQVEQFAGLISGAIQRGFDDAEQVLGDLVEMEDIGENIKRTYELVMEEIEHFRKEHFDQFESESNDETVDPQSELNENVDTDLDEQDS